MKFFIAFFFTAFLAGTSIAQDQTQNQLGQPPPQGWYQQISGTTGGLGGVYFLTRDSGWVADYPGALYTTNGGNNWQTYLPEVEVIAFIGSFGYGYSPKGDGWISVTTNRGQSWNDYNTEFDGAGLYYFCTPLRGFCHAIVNSRDRIARTVDGGKTWIADTKDTVGQIAGFACFDSLHAIAGGNGYPNPDGSGTFIAGIFYTSDGGVSWKFTMDKPIIDAGFAPFAAFDSTTVYFLGGAKKAYKSTNRGNTLNAFLFPSDAFISPNLEQAAYALDRNNITVVGGNGQIYRSYDGGNNWVRQNSGTVNTLYAVTFVDSTTGWAVGDAGTILHTTNGGYDWVKQQITADTLNMQTYPNPASTNLTVGFTLPQEQHVTISILDLTGKELMHPYSNEIQPQGINYLPLNIHVLPAGAYLLHISTECYDGTCKFTKIVP